MTNRTALRTPAQAFADKVSGHRSEVSYGADCLSGQKKRARRAYNRADRKASRAKCREYIG